MGLNRHCSKEDRQMAKSTSHQGNANQNHSVISSHTRMAEVIKRASMC